MHYSFRFVPLLMNLKDIAPSTYDYTRPTNGLLPLSQWLYRRRLLQMTVGARFPLPFPSHPFSFSPFPSPLLTLTPFSPLFPFPPLVFCFLPYPCPLNSAKGFGERCKLLQWVRPPNIIIIECIKRYRLHKMLASLLRLIAKGPKMVEPDAYMQKLTHFPLHKIDITKIPVGRLGGIAPTTFRPWGRSPPSTAWVGACGNEHIIAITIRTCSFFPSLLMGGATTLVDYIQWAHRGNYEIL